MGALKELRQERRWGTDPQTDFHGALLLRCAGTSSSLRAMAKYPCTYFTPSCVRSYLASLEGL